jgi:hypothetical protein
VNTNPWYEVMVFGAPWIDTILSRYTSAKLSNEYFWLVGMKCADLVSRSTTTHIASLLRKVMGRPVIKSMHISSHFQSGISSGFNNPAGR